MKGKYELRVGLEGSDVENISILRGTFETIEELLEELGRSVETTANIMSYYLPMREEIADAEL